MDWKLLGSLDSAIRLFSRRTFIASLGQSHMKCLESWLMMNPSEQMQFVDRELDQTIYDIEIIPKLSSFLSHSMFLLMLLGIFISLHLDQSNEV